MLSYQNCTDQELVSLIKVDDHGAFSEIYHRYSGLLYLHAYKRLNDREEAKDIVQELFTALWNNRTEFTLHTHLSGYLYTAIRNRVIKVISHKTVVSTYFSSLQTAFRQGNAVSDHLIREKELSHLIEKEINALPPKMRRVFTLSRKAYLSHREIAEKLDLSEATVKKQVNNALKILRAKLETLLFIGLFLCLFLWSIPSHFIFFKFFYAQAQS